MNTKYNNGIHIASFSQEDGTIQKVEKGYVLLDNNKIIATHGFKLEEVPEILTVSDSWSLSKLTKSYQIPDALELEVEELRENIETHDHGRNYDNNVLLGHKLKSKDNKILISI